MAQAILTLLQNQMSLSSQQVADYLSIWKKAFLRVRCESCYHERLVGFSCKGRGFCPSCGARLMVESAALLLDEVLPEQPMRKWVLSIPFPLRLLLAKEPDILSKVLGIIYRAIASFLVKQSGHTHKQAKTGAVTLIQRFGSAF